MHCGNANCSAGNVTATPDDGARPVQTSIALDAGGRPVVGYGTGPGNTPIDRLKVLHCGNANCDAGNNFAIPDGSAGGELGSLVLDPSGNPVISHAGNPSNDISVFDLDLKVTRCGNPFCTAGNSTVSPDTGGNVGALASTALDAAGNPVVSYWDLSNNDLKVLHCWTPTCAVAKGEFQGAYQKTDEGFIEIGGKGSETGASGCDDCASLVPIGFTFNFYGADFTSAYVSSNGNLQFDSANGGFSNTTLPAAGFGRSIFAWWDDLYNVDPICGYNSDVKYQTVGAAPNRVFVVEWENVCHFPTAGEDFPLGAVTFEVLLYETTNEILLRYLDTDFENDFTQGGPYDLGASATVGVQASAGGPSTVYSVDTAILTDGFAIPIRPDGTGGYTAGIAFTGTVVPDKSSCDDCTQNVPIGFTFNMYGQDFTTVNVGSNGNIQFDSALADWTNGAMPASGFGRTVFAWWDDLDADGCPTAADVYRQTLGTAPNRVFVVRWFSYCRFNNLPAIDFEIALYETSNKIRILYFDTALGAPFANPTIDNGASATVGIQRNDAGPFLQHSFDASSLYNGLLLTFSPDYDNDSVPNKAEVDADSDGCTNAAEQNTAVGSETSGGLRNWKDFWDFYDTPDETNVRDKAISGFDFFRVLGRFASVGDASIDPRSAPAPSPAYHPAFDRGGVGGTNPWNLLPANGAIAGTDIFSVLGQFAHICA